MAYPLDPIGTDYTNVFSVTPLPPYPFQHSSLARLLPVSFYNASLEASLPISFSILYYIFAHSANRWQSNKDRTKGGSLNARLLRLFIVIHNAFLCIYSFLTFAAMAPVVLDLFWQGYRAAGHAGLQLALCSIPTNNSLLGRWAYLFYLSKYYEVIDSAILYLKGKRIGNLQSYHHAGALICMWIAYRFQSQPVWVFCVFNAGVHTLMYAYYLFSALHLPFPKTLKRNLTTLQMIQIASGTIITNLYFVQMLDPAKVFSHLVAKSVFSLLPPSVFSSAQELSSLRHHDALSSPSAWLSNGRTGVGRDELMQLSTYAKARMSYGAGRGSCLERKGAALALHVNTMYMTPLLALFANFFAKSYLTKSTINPRTNGTKGKR